MGAIAIINTMFLALLHLWYSWKYIVLFHETSFFIQFVLSAGVVCAYSNEASLEYVRESLEKSLLTQLESEESTPTPPITVLFAPDPDLDHNAAQHLHDEGAKLADRWEHVRFCVPLLSGANVCINDNDDDNVVSDNVHDNVHDDDEDMDIT